MQPESVLCFTMGRLNPLTGLNLYHNLHRDGKLQKLIVLSRIGLQRVFLLTSI